MEYVPIENDAAWLSHQVGDRWLRVLSTAEAEALAAMLAAVKATGKPMLDILPTDAPLGAFAPAVGELRQQLERGIGFMTLRGVPSARFTAEDNRLLFWSLATHLGVARPQGKASQLMSDVRAAGGTYRAVGGRGYNTNAELDYHVDAADWVGLYCLQVARSGGLSRLASTAAIHNHLLQHEPALLRRLYEPFPHNRQNEEAADEAPWYWAPVFGTAGGQFAARYIRNHIRSGQGRPEVPRLTDLDHRALDIIQELAESDRFRFDMVLHPGDMQWVNNHVLIHSRTQFEDWEEPERRRHLLRLWLSVPGARPLAEGFRDAYKAVETDTVRGGFQGQAVTPAMVAYQARAAAALGMRDTPYRPAIAE